LHFKLETALLFKEKLRSLSPKDSDEVLIKQKIAPHLSESGVVFVGAGKKTVDVQEIKDRFTSLGIVVDWKRVDKITRVRNDIEHYCTTESRGRLKELVADSFVVIRDFLASQLGLQPVETLSADTWQVLLEVADVYRAELDECHSQMEAVDWKSDTLALAIEKLRCQECGSELVKPVDPNTDDPAWSSCYCASCGSEFQLDGGMIEGVLAEHFAGDSYTAMTDGGDPPTTVCPECGLDTFVYEEDRCIVCLAGRSYTECWICGADLDPSEQDLGGLCGYHYHVSHKDD